ncbi:MAG: hypothetical protein R3C03_12480 [Pirellulaceae bacterium]
MIELIADLNRSTMTALLMLGLVSFFGGIMLMTSHRREWLAAIRESRTRRELKYEDKTFRRRAIIAALISALGAVMFATYFTRDPKTFAIMVGLMFILLISLLTFGFLDMLHVGLHHATRSDDKARKEMVRKYLELRKQLKPDEDDPKALDQNDSKQ